MVYWCTGCILVYGLYTGVQVVYWCTGCILVYRLYTGVQAVYWCMGCILVYRLQLYWCTGYTGVHVQDKMAESGLSNHSPHSELMYSTQVLE